MSFEKILNKSNSYKFYKNNYLSLSEKINDYECELKNLNIELDNLKSDLDIFINRLIENDNDYQFIFSVIIALYNTELYLKDALDSIINQSFPLDKIQIILIDDGSTDNSKKICEEYMEKYPNNFVYIYQENKGQANARNNGLNYAKGKYLNFLDSDDKLELNTLKEVYYHFIKFGEEIDVITIPRYFFGALNGPAPNSEKYTKNRIVDIESEYDFPQVAINASFIRSDSLHEKFDSRLVISEDSLLLNKTILNKGKFGVLGNVKYLYRKREELNSTIDTKKTQKEYFSLRMEIYFKELINYSSEIYNHVPKYIQSVLIYDLYWLFKQKTEVNILSDDEKKEFYNHIFDVMQYIEDELILSQNFEESVKKVMIKFKHGECDFNGL